MSERWVPLLAALVGLLGGMGGAYIGGSVANEGQQQRFENEQEARMQDLRRNTYADFLQEAAGVNSGAIKSFEDLDAAEAKVEFFANTEIRETALALAGAVETRRRARITTHCENSSSMRRRPS